ETATLIPTCIGALGQWRPTQGMLNICHVRIASAACRHVTSPLPSWTRLWSTLYPVGAAVADAPISEYEKSESFCFEIKRRISSSEGAVRLNTVYPFLYGASVLRTGPRPPPQNLISHSFSATRARRKAQDSLPPAKKRAGLGERVPRRMLFPWASRRAKNKSHRQESAQSSKSR